MGSTKLNLGEAALLDLSNARIATNRSEYNIFGVVVRLSHLVELNCVPVDILDVCFDWQVSVEKGEMFFESMIFVEVHAPLMRNQLPTMLVVASSSCVGRCGQD